jgi:hypothetical protein
LEVAIVTGANCISLQSELMTQRQFLVKSNSTSEEVTTLKKFSSAAIGTPCTSCQIPSLPHPFTLSG